MSKEYDYEKAVTNVGNRYQLVLAASAHYRRTKKRVNKNFKQDEALAEFSELPIERILKKS